jgi:hypothetical protein
LRAVDLRFTPAEATDFLKQVIGLNLSAEDVTALETRTEGWIAGLQLAAISMQGRQDLASFIKSFTSSALPPTVIKRLRRQLNCILGLTPEGMDAPPEGWPCPLPVPAAS